MEGHARDRLRDRRLSAPGKGGHEARRIEPEGITLTERDKGANKKINNIAMENEDYLRQPVI
jgi:5-deoxy-D-glucuronate isomerase